ncbi:MAG: GNAT family N-acetyltransferase [Nocardioides sp.]|nr:GNAT family N-acetyltransferase [Nocardioides sp.]
MRPEDVVTAERLSAEAFREVDRRSLRPGDAEPSLRSPERAAGWVSRTEHLLRTDPGGCWVAEDADGSLAGFATSFVRDTTWFLATYAVRPGLQGQGLGRQLLDAAMGHGRHCLHGMLSASSDPAATRRYLLAGFRLHPQMYLTGTLDRSVLPVVEHVREGTPADTDLMDSVDRRARGAAHGPDHALMQSIWRPLVSERGTGQGYAYVGHDGSLALLAATDRRTATRLLWAVLADGPAEPTVPHLTAANPWALDVGVQARLDVRTEGYLALRGMRPPAPYVHNGALL